MKHAVFVFKTHASHIKTDDVNVIRYVCEYMFELVRMMYVQIMSRFRWIVVSTCFAAVVCVWWIRLRVVRHCRTIASEYSFSPNVCMLECSAFAAYRLLCALIVHNSLSFSAKNWTTIQQPSKYKISHRFTLVIVETRFETDVTRLFPTESYLASRVINSKRNKLSKNLNLWKFCFLSLFIFFLKICTIFQ